MPLTSTEFALLVAFVERSGGVVSRDQLMDLLYGNSVHVTDRAIDAHVAWLRRKLEQAGGSGEMIKTVHGTGYAFASRLESDETPSA